MAQYVDNNGLIYILETLKSEGASTLAAAQEYSDSIAANYVLTVNLEAAIADLGYLTATSADLKYAAITDLDTVQANISDLTTEVSKINDAYITTAEVGSLLSSYIKTDDLAATVAEFGYLKASDAALTYATVSELDSEIATIKEAYITTADVNELLANNITTTNLQAAVAEFGYLKAETAEITYANIELSNVDVESVGTLFANVGILTSMEVVDGYVTGMLNGVTINADVITTGTLSVDRLLLTGSDGLIYEINATSAGLTETELTDTVYQEYLNGTVIVASSITATQIAAGTITANEIASNTIEAGNIKAGTITGNEIAAGTITATNIAANSITANELDVSELSAITADLGDVTAGTITVYKTESGDTYTTTTIVFKADMDSGTVEINTDGFTLTADGDATFSGELSAATGTFTGELVAASGTFSGTLSGADGDFSGSVTATALTVTADYWTLSQTTSGFVIDANVGGDPLGESNFSMSEGKINLEAYTVHINATRALTIESGVTYFNGGAQFNDGATFCSTTTCDGCNFRVDKSGTTTNAQVVVKSNTMQICLYANYNSGAGIWDDTHSASIVSVETSGNSVFGNTAYASKISGTNLELNGYTGNIRAQSHMLIRPHATLSEDGTTGRVLQVQRNASDTWATSTTNDAILVCGVDSTAPYLRSMAVYSRTGTSSANVYINSNGTFSRYQSSASRYKNTINYFSKVEHATLEGLTKRAYTVTENDFREECRSILNIPVVQFHYNQGYITGEPDYNYSQYVTGFIAEDVESNSPACATYTADGEIEAWDSMQMIPRMVYVLQEHDTEIQDQSGKIEYLQAQIDMLTAEIDSLRSQVSAVG